MGIGPFSTYSPPAVYASTSSAPVLNQILGGLRVPVLIGVAQNSLTQTNFELIRGSSSVADTPVYGEDPTGQFIAGGTNAQPVLGNANGVITSFKVRNYPIVDGSGVGRVTYDTTKISVTVNGNQAVVTSVDGQNGIVQLLIPPQSTDVISVNYYFHRGDTRIIDNLSYQVTATAAILIAPKTETYNVITGTNDTLNLTIDDTNSVSITLTAGSARSAASVCQDINAAAVTDLTASVHVDNNGLNHVQLVSQGNILVGYGNANGTLGLNPGQTTGRNKVFTVFNGPIVDGSGGGITTTDPSHVTVLVNNQQVLASAVDGINQKVTLGFAPKPGSTVAITYYFNTWQDTFDYLPNSNVLSVTNCGVGPNRTDYNQGPDFVVVNDGEQSTIQWGTAYTVAAGTTNGTASFDSTVITGLLVDNRVYGVPLTRYTDPTTNSVSTTTFVLPLSPTTGNGRDTPLGQSLYQTISNGRIDLPTNRPDLVIVYVGSSWRDAVAHSPVKVYSVDSSTNLVVLENPVSSDYQAFATFWYNRIGEDVFTFTVQASGPSGVGQYTVSSQATGNQLYNVTFGNVTGLSKQVQWPSGVQNEPDAFFTGAGSPTNETVTVQFLDSLSPAFGASFTNANSDPYDLYTYSDKFGGVVIDGNAAVTIDLSTAFKAELVGSAISNPTALVFQTTDYIQLNIDGITIAAVSMNGITTVAGVVTALNTAIDADTQVHADGTGTFHSTLANGLVSATTFGGVASSLLQIKGRNTPSATNGYISNVTIVKPTGAGQTDGSAVVGLLDNQTSFGSFNALNQPAQLIGTIAAPYNIQLGVSDNLQLNIDGTSYNVTLPSNSAVPITAVSIQTSATGASVGQTLPQATIFTVDDPAVQGFPTSGQIALLTGPGTLTIVMYTGIDSVHKAFTGCAGGNGYTIGALNAISGVGVIEAINYATSVTTAITAASNGAALPQATINVTSTAGFNTYGGTATIIIGGSPVNITYTGITPTALTGCSSGSGTLATGQTVFSGASVASVGAGQYLNELVLTSHTNEQTSQLAVLQASTANNVLGFTSGISSTRIQPTAANIATALNANSGFGLHGVAYSINVSGLGNFLNINSRSVGTTSNVSFTSIGNTSFTNDTGLGIVPGSSGAIGEASMAGFRVTSSAGLLGSHGTGFPGQTYTDATTGLRFTILPASSGDYDNTGSFTMNVGQTFTCDATVPTKAVPGVELYVYNTINMTPGTTGVVSTFPHKGVQPAIGDVYYISYQYGKTNFSPALFRDRKTIQTNVGPPVPAYPLSLAASLSLLNGAVIVGLEQVLPATGQSQASDATFTAAIDALRKPISGTVKADVITPLTTDPTVMTYLNQHCIFMSSPRQEGERTGVVGVAVGTTPTGVGAIAQGLASELMMVVYPDSFVITITDAVGNSTEQLIDGSYCAAALAGSTCNPSIDVATPITRRQILGFTSLGTVLDPTVANQVAVSGVTIIEQVKTGLRVRHGLTTRLDTVITRTPSVTLTIQFVQQTMRAELDPFIGAKQLSSTLQNINNQVTGMFGTLIDKQIVASVSGISVAVSPTDPTIITTETIYVPVFPIEYVVCALQIRTSS